MQAGNRRLTIEITAERKQSGRPTRVTVGLPLFVLHQGANRMAMRSDPIGKALAEALGIPAELVYRVRLDVTAGDVLRAEIDFYPAITEEQLAIITERYVSRERL